MAGSMREGGQPGYEGIMSLDGATRLIKNLL